ncbi:hypothetical protein P691DRAFT_809479 [Macrolepiota fuliginosa MF-IS2]|uniref:Uncharacterized protein n=1 Tax=Macrolepiota fuliginosa MF-IS2 TaxID=1400762 RepID=A0A9P5XJN3_9AGAR|nr:hypothetical protein P691DRAFT_809479 [Macrolepiota fuliginosa MF-IS2]
MKSLKRWAIWTLVILFIIGIVCMVSLNILAGVILIWLAILAFVILELLVGTMFVEKDTWIVIEDHIAPGRDAYRWLQTQDPTFDNASEWGSRQLIPQWDPPHPRGPSPPGNLPHPYAATLIDLRTGVLTRAAVTSRPNDMVLLAVHGGGVTCMLLDRDEKAVKATVAVKVGMANLPPFVLAQAEDSGTVYVGGGPFREQPGSPGTFSTLQTSYTNSGASATDSYDAEKFGGGFGSPTAPSLRRNA